MRKLQLEDWPQTPQHAKGHVKPVQSHMAQAKKVRSRWYGGENMYEEVSITLQTAISTQGSGQLSAELCR